jgi:broad specificity phosphatase PhoE
MLKIYLARHGQNEDNAKGILNGHRDLPLTEIGERQAHELAASIKAAGLKFDKIYCSPLVRARRTAEIIAEDDGFGMPEVLPELIERDFGIMSGKLAKDILEICGEEGVLKTDTITYFLNPEGAETFPELVERGKLLLEKIKSLHDDGNILLVGHGDFLKMVVAAFYDLSWEEVLKLFHFGNSELVLLEEGVKADKMKVISLEQFNH